METFIILLIVVLVVVAVIFFGMYNSLIGKRNQVDNAYSSIDVMLKKRYDLIPNLVATVQQYMTHERDLLTEITELRTRAIAGDQPLENRLQTEQQLSGALSRLAVSVENYPELKANQNFLQLQGSLNEIEEQISAARRAYNASVTDYNNAIEMVPTNIVAGMMSLSKRPLFEAAEVERGSVDVRSMFQGGR